MAARAISGAVYALEREKRFDDMGSALLEQIAVARFVDSGGSARHLRHPGDVARHAGCLSRSIAAGLRGLRAW